APRRDGLPAARGAAARAACRRAYAARNRDRLIAVTETTMRRLLHCIAFVLACGIAPAALAQAWPSKPIRIVVNFPPGGAADQIARAVAPQLQTALGQTVVVENRAGSGGNIGGEAVAKSPPDGYTLLMSSGGMVSVNPHIYAKMPFDPAKDLVPVAAAARVL